MRPVEMLFGPTGATMVEFNENAATVWCRNSLYKKDVCFNIDNATGMKIAKWIAEGKPGMVQDVFPELDIDQREMLISGIDNFDEFIGS